MNNYPYFLNQNYNPNYEQYIIEELRKINQTLKDIDCKLNNLKENKKPEKEDNFYIV